MLFYTVTLQDMLSKHLGSFLLCLNLLIFASLIGKSQETIYGFCGKDFVVLGRHSWRCKDRLIINSVTVDNPVTADNGPSHITCKQVKGQKQLVIHLQTQTM